MESAFLSCPICYEDFDTNKHTPRIIPLCGHTICSVCLKKLLDAPTQRKCPLDSQPFSSELKTIESFPLNFAVTQILQVRLKKDLCQTHREEMSFFCATDQCNICSTCVCQTHEGHKVKSLKLITSEAKDHLKKAAGFVADLDTFNSKVNETSKEIKTVLIKAIKDEFEKARNCLVKKEEEITNKILSQIEAEETRMIALTGPRSYFRGRFDSTLSESGNLLRKDGLLKDEQLIQKIRKFSEYTIDLSAIDVEKQMVQSKIQKMSDSFETLLKSHTENLLSLEFPTKIELFEGLPQKAVKGSLEDNGEDEAGKTLPIACLHYKIEGTTLKISSDPLLKKEAVIDFEKCQRVDSVHLKLRDCNFDKQDLQVFSLVWNKLKQVSHLKLDFIIKPILESVMDIIIQGSVNPSNFSIILQDECPSDHLNLILKFENILKKAKDIKSLSLSLFGSTALIWEVKTMLKTRPFDASGLEEFDLKLSGPRIDGFLDIVFEMPRVKNFRIDLSNTDIGNKSIEQIITISMQHWKIGHLKSLDLNLSNTKIKSKALGDLTSMAPIFSDSLERLSLNLTGCQCIASGLTSLFHTQFSKLISLDLNLNNTGISDDSIKKLSLTRMTGLQSLILCLSKTKVTDIGVSRLFGPIKDLKIFYLDLQLKDVTDKSLKPFIMDKVSKMTSLTKFKIITDPKISSELRTVIDNLEKTYNFYA